MFWTERPVADHHEAVEVTLSELLLLPPVASAAPEVLTGDPVSCMVRWVHSSEVAEMGPLLRGGELLLTTGLGQRASTDADQERYIDALADAGLAALALELGRSFSVPPSAMVQAAMRRDITFIVLHEVMPFETIIEAFHELLLDRQLGSLRLGDAIWRQLLEVIVGGGGLQGFVALTAKLTGAPACLLARDGRIVAASQIGADVPPERHRSAEDVIIAGVRWGSIVVAGPRSAAIDSVLERAAALVSLELSRSGDPRNRPSHATALLRDIVENRLPSVSEMRARCEVVGFPSQRGRPLIGIAIAADRRTPRQPLLAGAERACRNTFGTCMVGELQDDIIAITRAPGDEDPKQLRIRLERLTTQLTESIERTSGHSVIAVGAGALADDFDDLPKSIEQAQEAVDVARRLGAHHATLLSRDVGVYRLLAHLQGRPELSDFISEQLGPLLDYDTLHNTNLVRTLDVYLSHALSKTAAARVLGVRRQTLYDRLTRIEQILGTVALTDHQHRDALSLALRAWRLRTGLDPARELG